MTTADVDACRPLRRDAARNRELILTAAAEVFAEQGIDGGYDEIARRAGVGVGTVYRRFPERAELVQALFESRIDAIAALAEEAGSCADAFEGLVGFLEATVAQHVADRGLKEVMFQTVSADEQGRLGRDRLGPLMECLVERARAEGALRDGVTATDIGMVMVLLGTLEDEHAPGLWRRYLTAYLDGLRARPDQSPLPLEGPDEAVIHALMAPRRGR